ncbi:MAG: sulfotransferase [Planctomycetaceae bacterium]|nr:sulfotransferase [Planctomycetaceae bacterium]
MTRGFGPGCLAGIRFGDWCKLLAANRFHVDFRYWGKACHISIASLVTSPIAMLEHFLYGPAIETTRIESPLFILGSWRSGTTHLHNLLCQDNRFAAPDLYMTMYPHTYRLSRVWWEPVLATLTPRKRFMDNVKMSLREPAEDEMALGILARASNSLSWVFPEKAERYDRHLSFEQASNADRKRFEEAFRFFVAKSQQSLGRPLILKSPNHTARIEMILKLFPDAKFLHIRRNPYDVFRSFVHMASQVIPVWGLQVFDMNQLEQMVLETYRELYEAYFRHKDSIPAGQFHEVSYEDLVERPIQELEAAYSTLQLPNFEAARPQIEAYVASTGEYRRNKHVDIPDETLERIHQEWKFCFDAWGYELRSLAATQGS